MWRANNAIIWEMRLNSAFIGLILLRKYTALAVDFGLCQAGANALAGTEMRQQSYELI
jgi:hypothetical protein